MKISHYEHTVSPIVGLLIKSYIQFRVLSTQNCLKKELYNLVKSNT